MPDDKTVINQTRCWIKSVIVGLNFCPFAGREVNNNSIHYQVNHDEKIEQVLHCLANELVRLDQQPEIETTLLIFVKGFKGFDEYLDLVEIANSLLVQQGYEGVYQVASFHPGYCFAGEPADDAANFTNRSPYPMLHLIREASLETALKNYPDPELIPERNIKLAREKGANEMQKMLMECMQNTDG